MEQRIITLTKRFPVMDNYGFNLDGEVQALNSSGWVIKQIVSTSFEHTVGTMQYPVIAITLLVEKSK